MDEDMIAYCGMNCELCSAYLKKRKNPCPGCKPRGMGCLHPGGKGLCEKVHNKEVEFCFECEDFPCKRLKNLDKRLRDETGLPVSMAEEPLASVALGTGKMLSDMALLRKICIER